MMRSKSTDNQTTKLKGNQIKPFKAELDLVILGKKSQRRTNPIKNFIKQDIDIYYNFEDFNILIVKLTSHFQ